MRRSTLPLCFAAVVGFSLGATVSGCGEQSAAPAPDAGADVGSAAVQASLQAEGPSYIRVDWVGRFAFTVCSTEGALLQIDWGDSYQDKLDLDVVSLPAASTGCRVFRTSHIYGGVGPIEVKASVQWPDGRARTATLPVAILPVPSFVPHHASPIALAAPYAVAVSTDADQITVFERSTSQEWLFKRRVDTCNTPRTAAANGNWVAITCQGDDRLQVFKINDGNKRSEVKFRHGARPYGVVWPTIAPGQKADLYVTLQGTGEVARLVDNGSGKVALADTVTVVTDARGIAALPDGKLAVTRWRSPAKRGELAIVDYAAKKVQLLPLQWADLAPADSESGGVPTYLDQPLVRPDGKQLLLPGMHANNRDGTFRNGTKLAHDSAVRAMIARVDLTTGKESLDDRWILENRGLAGAGAFSPDGAWLYVVMRGSRSIERFDLQKGVHSGTILDVGYAPEAVAVTTDGRWLLALAPLSRTFHTWRLPPYGPLPKAPTKSYELVAKEPLPKAVLRGKQLFNDSFDTRLAADGYIACAHCHLDGEADLRTWDFTDRGEGMRNTPSLHGRAGTGHGPVHWSANFDEIQDFEHDIRTAFGGTGLMTDADFAQAGTTMGPKKTGKSADLDALAAYLESLKAYPRSPHRRPDGTLTEAAKRGEKLFTSAETGCTTCHKGPQMTDSALVDGKPVLHDVGTIGSGSGKRLNAALPGLDTPTLHGLHNTAPYLHDGSAATLMDVLTTRNKGDKHGKTSHLSPAQLQDLVAWLLQLEGPGS